MNKSAHSTFSTERLTLFIILALALVARFQYLLQIEHNIDHGYPVWQALRTIDQGIFPTTGQYTSVLFDNPTMTGYLLIPVVALTRSPIGVYIFTITLNWLGVWLTYRVTRRMLGARPALIAAFLMAVNPWVIEYSRTSWVQSLLPFFATLTAWLLWPVLLGQSKRPVRRTALALFAATMMAHTYLLAFFIIAPVSLLLLIFRRRIPLRGAVIGGGVFILVTIPYIIGLAGEWDRVQNRVDNFSSGQAHLSGEALGHAVRLVTGAQYETARRRDSPEADYTRRHTLTTLAHIPLAGVMILGALGAGRAIYRKTAQRDSAIIALVWFGLPVIAMSYSSNPIHPTYQLVGLPAGYVLAAWGLDSVLRYGTIRRANLLLVALAIPFAALMLLNSARHWQNIKANPGAWNLDAAPVGYGIRVGKIINQVLPEGGSVFTNAMPYTLNSFSGRMFPVIYDVRAPALQVIPANGGLTIVAGQDEPPVPIGASRTAVIDFPKDKQITFDLFPPAAEVALPGNPVEIPSRQGLTLIRYDLSPTNDGWLLTTAWRVDFIAPEVYERIYGPFLHVSDSAGTLLLNISGEGLPGFRWSVGDVLVYQMPLILPDDASGPFSLRTGQYDGLHNANVMFMLPDGDNAVIPLPEFSP